MRHASLIHRAALILSCAAFFSSPAVAQEPDRNRTAIEALSRLQNVDLESNPALKAAVLRVLETTRGTPDFVKIVQQFKLRDQNAGLLEVAVKYPNDEAGVEAMRLILASKDTDLIRAALGSKETAIPVSQALGNTGDKQAVALLLPVVTEPKRDVEARKQAVRSLAKTQEGASALLGLAREGRLPDGVRFTASSELSQARWGEVKAEAAKLLPMPQSGGAEPLPPVAELLKMKGDARRGAEVYAREQSACMNCHQVNGKGIDFGPALSEIGDKLGKDALYEAIIDPSAGISFGYEAWQIELRNGDEAFGLIVSETENEIALKTQNGLTTRYDKKQIASRHKMMTSVMPADLQATMSVQDLVDMVEYLASLKKPSGQ